MAKYEHAEAMAQYAEDLFWNPEAWKGWEFSAPDTPDKFNSLNIHPSWTPGFSYRRKVVNKPTKDILEYSEILTQFSEDSKRIENPLPLWEMSIYGGDWMELTSPPKYNPNVKYRKRCPCKITSYRIPGTEVELNGLVSVDDLQDNHSVHYVYITHSGNRDIFVSKIYHATVAMMKANMNKGVKVFVFWYNADAERAAEELYKLSKLNPLKDLLDKKV